MWYLYATTGADQLSFWLQSIAREAAHALCQANHYQDGYYSRLLLLHLQIWTSMTSYRLKDVPWAVSG